MKKIIALAVASAFIAPAVLADVAIYGSIRSAIEYSQISDGATGDNISRTRLVDESSRLGFKGSDKLDAGVDVFWQVENKIRVGTGDQLSNWQERNTFVGLKGTFGSVQAGKFDDVMDQSRADFFTGLDNFDDTAGGVNSMYRPSKQRINNILQYSSPNFSGFNFKLAYDFGTKTNATNYQGYQGSAWYQNDLFKFGAAYKQNTDNAGKGFYTKPDGSADGLTVADGNFYKTLQVGANVTPVAGLDIAAVWNRVKTNKTTTATETRQDSWGLGGTYSSGKNAFQLSYAKVDNRHDNGAGMDGTGGWGVNAGYKYSLSKQTMLIAGLSYIKNGKNTNSFVPSTAFSASPNTVTIGNGATTKAVSLGLRTDF